MAVNGIMAVNKESVTKDAIGSASRVIEMQESTTSVESCLPAPIPLCYPDGSKDYKGETPRIVDACKSVGRRASAISILSPPSGPPPRLSEVSRSYYSNHRNRAWDSWKAIRCKKWKEVSLGLQG